jgi:hypothetical protein
VPAVNPVAGFSMNTSFTPASAALRKAGASAAASREGMESMTVGRAASAVSTSENCLAGSACASVLATMRMPSRSSSEVMPATCALLQLSPEKCMTTAAVAPIVLTRATSSSVSVTADWSGEVSPFGPLARTPPEPYAAMALS